MDGGERGGRQELGGEVAVGHGIERVAGHAAEPKGLRGGLAVKRKASTRKGARPER